MRRLGLALFLTATLAWAGTPWKINPGTSVGTVAIGGDSVAVAKSMGLGAGSAHALTNGLSYFQSEPAGLTVQYEKSTGKIVMITVTKAAGTVAGQPVDFQGEGGFTIGSSVPQMEAAYGRDYEARDLKSKVTDSSMYYAYKKRGLGVQFKGGRCEEIHIFPKH